MAIVSVKQTHTGRTADFDAAAGTGRIVCAYIVRTDSHLDGSLVVMNASGLPDYGAAYSAGGSESSSNWIVKRKVPRQRPESPLVWDVDVEYEPLDISGQGADEFDPTSEPTDYAWKTVQESREMPVDAYGLKAQTTAGEPFEDAPEAEMSARELTITRNEATFDSVAIDAFVNTLNYTPAFGYAANEGRIISIDASGEFDAVFGGYWEVTYVIQFRNTSMWVPTINSAKILPNGTYPSGVTAVTSIGPWDIVKRNAGTQRIDTIPNPDEIAPIVLKGHQISNVADLEPNGTQRTGSESAGDPYYLVFRPYLPVSWAPLDLE